MFGVTTFDKAITAGVLAGAGVFGALSTAAPLVRIGAAVGAGLVVGIATFWTKNKPSSDLPVDGPR